MAHHQQLLDWIENQLINNTLTLGDELPPDRELAHLVGMSQNHIRESLKHCEEIGILRLFEGRRKSIIAVLNREPAASAGTALGLYLAGAKSPRQDLLNTCMLLEGYALAGPTYDESALPELERILEAMQDATTSLSAFHDLEADFHIQLGRLSNNALISALLATLRDAMIESRFELVTQVPLWSATANRLRMEYRAIIDAVRSGDSALARTLLQANLHERFAEAGHQLEKPQAAPPEEPVASNQIQPVEVPEIEPMPNRWGQTLDPDLLNALATIQPKGSEGAAADELAPALDTTSLPVVRVSGTDEWGQDVPAPTQPAEVKGEKDEAAAPAGTGGSADQDLSEAPEARDVPTGSGVRKRRGTVSAAVHATVPTPAATVVAPETPTAGKTDDEPQETPAEPDTPLQPESDESSPEAPAVIPAETSSDAEPHAEPDEEPEAVPERPRHYPRLPAADLREKLKQEEARLAALAANAVETDHEAGTEGSLTDSPQGQPVAPIRGQGATATPAEPAQADTSQSLTDTAKALADRAKSFDLLGYFGFRQGPAATQRPAPEAPEENAEPLDAPEQGWEESDQPREKLREGYEYADEDYDDYVDEAPEEDSGQVEDSEQVEDRPSPEPQVAPRLRPQGKKKKKKKRR